MIFPNLGPEYLNENDRSILARMEAFYAEAITINQSFWAEADTDTRFECGDQTPWNDIYGNLSAARRKQLSLNRIRRIINMISGHQRRTRKSMVATPVENGDEETADQFTKILMWIANTEGVLETISDSFHGALVTGMNLLSVWVDYRSDPVSGSIKVDNCSYNSFLIDPYFRKPDLSDCNHIWKRSFLTKREIISLLPDKEEEIMGLSGNEGGTGRDGKFQFMPESYGYAYKNLLTYDEYYYRDYRSQRMLVDSETGESMEWKSEDEDALQAFLDMYPQVTVIKQDIPTVKLAIVVQGKVMYDGPNPLGIDKYPFIPVFAYYNPQMPYFPWRIQGVVRGLRDAQYLYNRRKIIELDILESQINSGFKYKENALVNPNDVFLFGQGKGLALKEEAQMTDVEQIIAPQIPPSMIQLSEILGREIQEISGVNEELLGSADDDKAGILSMLRQGAGLTTLQILFDNLDSAQSLLGKILIDVIQTNFTPGKISKILGNKQPAPQFYNKAFGKYHVRVEEGLNTATQQQMQFAQMLQLKEVGVPITNEDLLEAATFQGKKKVMENMQAQQQQAAQQAQQQAELQNAYLQSQTQWQQAEAINAQAKAQAQQAKAMADEGLAAERYSKIEDNQALAVERMYESQKDHELAILHKVKALKELEDMDLAAMQRLLALAQGLKNIETQEVDAMQMKAAQRNMNNVPPQDGFVG